MKNARHLENARTRDASRLSRLAFLYVFCVFLSLAGCTSPDGRVSVPRVPEWRAPADVRTFTTWEVVAECSRLAPGALVETSDATFTPINHEWLLAAVDWAWEFGKATGLDYTPESFDCDKFALGFAFAANVAAGRAKVKAQPLLARIHVNQFATFGGVPAGGGHALNAFLSDRGLYVLEPQPGGAKQLVPLAEYPNRGSIFRIKIGG